MKTFRTEIDGKTTTTSFFGIEIFRQEFEIVTQFINSSKSTKATTDYFIFGLKYKTVITK